MGTVQLILYVVKGRGERRLLALASKDRLLRILEKMLDEDEFFSEHGIRSYARALKLLSVLCSLPSSQTVQEAQRQTVGHGRPRPTL